EAPCVADLAFPTSLDAGITMYSLRSNTFIAAVSLVVLVGAASACGGDNKSAATTTPATTSVTTDAPATTEAPTTSAAATTTTEAATTTTVPAKPVYPLTGIDNPDPAIAARPALVVKID